MSICECVTLFFQLSSITLTSSVEFIDGTGTWNFSVETGFALEAFPIIVTRYARIRNCVGKVHTALIATSWTFPKVVKQKVAKPQYCCFHRLNYREHAVSTGSHSVLV